MDEKPKFGGMTVNERLVVARLIGQWDHAVNARDRDTMIEILKKAEFPETESGRVADTVLANPAKYGF
jgi:hypothetical protein